LSHVQSNLPTLDYILVGQDLVHVATHEHRALTNAEYHKATLMFSAYTLAYGSMMIAARDDFSTLVDAFNDYFAMTHMYH